MDHLNVSFSSFLLSHSLVLYDDPVPLPSVDVASASKVTIAPIALLCPDVNEVPANNPSTVTVKLDGEECSALSVSISQEACDSRSFSCFVLSLSFTANIAHRVESCVM